MDLRYPIGRFAYEAEPAAAVIEKWIEEIGETPVWLREAVEGLGEEQLDTVYRPGGWTIRQVVHHIADSHLNSYIRFKMALTETNPTIKPYMEEKWAELPDSSAPVEASLKLVEGLHTRWVNLLHSLGKAELDKPFQHPESGEVKLWENIGLYAWHGRHHIAHITSLRKRMDW